MPLDDFRFGVFDFGDTRQHDNRNVIETFVEPHLFEHFEPRAIVGESQVENDGVDSRRFSVASGPVSGSQACSTSQPARAKNCSRMHRVVSASSTTSTVRRVRV